MKPHKDKKNYLKKLANLVDDVIAASDDFESCRGKLASKLEAGQVPEALEVRNMLDKKIVANEKHQRLVTCIVNHKHCCSDKERAEVAEALACGYKHLKQLLTDNRNT